MFPPSQILDQTHQIAFGIRSRDHQGANCDLSQRLEGLDAPLFYELQLDSTKSSAAIDLPVATANPDATPCCWRLLVDMAYQASKVRKGEGFEMPLGVAKPPMQEPAVRMRWAMGFSDLVWSCGCQELRHMA